MTFLAVVFVLIFSFAFVVGDARPAAPVTSGILWIALVVSGTVGLGRTFDCEREGEAIRSLLLSPTARSAIDLGKLAATVALMLLVEVVLTFLAGLLFSNRVAADFRPVATLLVLGTIGFAAVGCVFSAALLRSRSRDVLSLRAALPNHHPHRHRGREGHLAAHRSHLARPRRRALLDAVPRRDRRRLRDPRPLGLLEPVVTGE